MRGCMQAVRQAFASPLMVFASWPEGGPHPGRVLSAEDAVHPFVLLSGTEGWSYAGFEPIQQLGSLEEAHRSVVLGKAPSGVIEPDLPPFRGGAVGYLSYDQGWQYVARPRRPRPDPFGMPGASFGVYDTVYARHEPSKRSYLLTRDRPESLARARRLHQALTKSTRIKEGRLVGRLQPRLDKASYEARVRAALSLIEDGDIYQLNLTYPMEARFQGHPSEAFARLAQNAPPFAAYLAFGDSGHVISASPECFIEVDPAGRIRSYPIKGTKRRAAAPEAEVASLLHDAKEKAEHTMIVDLIRNDLGRICVPGSVHVPKLRYVESFPTLHHLVSCIEGKLNCDTSMRELLQATFPGGSITGAPKLRAMEMIDALEQEARGLYCGTILWLDASGALCGNIAIRTAQIQDGWLRLGVGGGIVADSVPAREWEETHLKAESIERALRGRKGQPLPRAWARHRFTR